MAALRQPIIDEAEAIGWLLYENPSGWSLWHPPDWVVAGDGADAIFEIPGVAVIGVLPFDDTDAAEDSSDYLLWSLADMGVAGFIAAVHFSEGDLILDVDQDGVDGDYDIWGVPVEYGGLGDGTETVPGWAYAYYNPNTLSDLGYFLNVIDIEARGDGLREIVESVFLTFEPAGGY